MQTPVSGFIFGQLNTPDLQGFNYSDSKWSRMRSARELYKICKIPENSQLPLIKEKYSGKPGNYELPFNSLRVSPGGPEVIKKSLKRLGSGKNTTVFRSSKPLIPYSIHAAIQTSPNFWKPRVTTNDAQTSPFNSSFWKSTNETQTNPFLCNCISKPTIISNDRSPIITISPVDSQKAHAIQSSQNKDKIVEKLPKNKRVEINEMIKSKLKYRLVKPKCFYEHLIKIDNKNPKKKFICGFKGCGKRYSQYKTACSHYSDKHDDFVPDTFYDILCDLPLVTKNGKWTCCLCDPNEPFATQEKYRAHRDYVHKKQVYSCQELNCTFTTKETIERKGHIAKHSFFEKLSTESKCLYTITEGEKFERTRILKSHWSSIYQVWGNIFVVNKKTYIYTGYSNLFCPESAATREITGNDTCRVIDILPAKGKAKIFIPTNAFSYGIYADSRQSAEWVRSIVRYLTDSYCSKHNYNFVQYFTINEMNALIDTVKNCAFLTPIMNVVNERSALLIKDYYNLRANFLIRNN